MKRTKWWLTPVVAVAGLMLGASGQASADSTCTTYNTYNGTESFPGTYVGTVGAAGCQIGVLFPNQSSDAAAVNNTSNPSIYEFYYAGGGSLTIQEELGNNGIDDPIDVELYSLATQSSTSGTKLASIQIPYTSGPSGEYNLVTNDPLAAGYYAIDTYLSINQVTDPEYQINITDPPGVPTPEPSSALMLMGGLSGLGFLRRRKVSV